MAKIASLIAAAALSASCFGQRHEMPSQDGEKKLVIEHEYMLPTIELVKIKFQEHRPLLEDSFGADRISGVLAEIENEEPQSEPRAVFGEELPLIDSACLAIARKEGPVTSLSIEGCHPASDVVYVEMRIGREYFSLSGQVSPEGAIYLSYYLEGDPMLRQLIRKKKATLILRDGEREYSASFDISTAREGYARIIK